MSYKKGDLVEVYSLQSFHGGGFLNGELGIVSQDQRCGGSVLVTVKRKNEKGDLFVDTSYEVYPEQLKKVKGSKRSYVEEFELFVRKVRGDCMIRTINETENHCFYCRGWIPLNTLGGKLRCSHCNKWQPEIKR